MWKTISLICYLILLSIFDIRIRKVPAVWLLIGGAAALVNLIYLCCCQPFAELLPEVLKSLGPGLLMLTAGRLSGKIGSGDGCVLLVAGSILGSVKIMAVFSGGLLLVAATAGVLLILRKAGKNDRLPFIPFLTVSAILWEVM